MEPITFTTAVVLALLAFIIALLIKIILDLLKLRAAGAHDGPAAATNAGIAAMLSAVSMIQEIRSRENPRPTKAECVTLKKLLDEAIAGNVSQLALAPVHAAISSLCGG